MRRDDPGPYSLDALRALTPPQIFTTDATSLKARYVAWFEAASGRKLYPMQVEMLLIEALAYAMSVLGVEGQIVASQHLVAFADISGLERLGPNRSTPRLAASRARTTMRFSVDPPREEATLVAAGCRVSAGEIVFAALTPAVIPAGAVSAEVEAEAQTDGAAGNGFLPGQIATMLDPVAGVAAVNLTTSEGGADIEDVELYRLRVANAFERISTGGSQAWYRETTMGASPAVIDVAVVRPAPCYVDLYPLTRTGAAGAELSAQIAAVFNTDAALDIRFGDHVALQAATGVAAAPVFAVRVRGAAASIAADAQAAAAAVLDGWRYRLGAVVAPSEAEAAIRALPGVVDVETVGGLVFRELSAHEFLDAAAPVIDLTVLA